LLALLGAHHILHVSRKRVNIKICCKEIGWEGMGWIHLAEDGDKWWALVNVVMNLVVL